MIRLRIVWKKLAARPKAKPLDFRDSSLPSGGDLSPSKVFKVN